MKATEVLTLLNEGNVEELKRMCELEIFAENLNQKKKGKDNPKKLIEARERVAKKFVKSMAYRPGLAGAYELNGKQMLCDGCVGLMFNDIIPGLPSAKPEASPFDLEKVFPQQSALIEIHPDIDLNEVKALRKIVKAQNKKAGEEYMMVKIGEACYQSAYLLDLVPTLSGELFWYQKGKVAPINQMLVIEGENGKVIILPYVYRGEPGKEIPPMKEYPIN